MTSNKFSSHFLLLWHKRHYTFGRLRHIHTAWLVLWPRLKRLTHSFFKISLSILFLDQIRSPFAALYSALSNSDKNLLEPISYFTRVSSELLPSFSYQNKPTHFLTRKNKLSLIFTSVLFSVTFTLHNEGHAHCYHLCWISLTTLVSHSFIPFSFVLSLWLILRHSIFTLNKWLTVFSGGSWINHLFPLLHLLQDTQVPQVPEQVSTGKCR